MTLSDIDSISPYTEFTSREGSIADDEDVADRHNDTPHGLENNKEFAWEDLPMADLLNFRRRIFVLARTLFPNEVLRIMWRENCTPEIAQLAVSLVRPDGLALLVGPLAVGCGAAYQALISLMEGMLEDEMREREREKHEEQIVENEGDEEKGEGEKEDDG